MAHCSPWLRHGDDLAPPAQERLEGKQQQVHADSQRADENDARFDLDVDAKVEALEDEVAKVWHAEERRDGGDTDGGDGGDTQPRHNNGQCQRKADPQEHLPLGHAHRTAHFEQRRVYGAYRRDDVANEHDLCVEHQRNDDGRRVESRDGDQQRHERQARQRRENARRRDGWQIDFRVARGEHAEGNRDQQPDGQTYPRDDEVLEQQVWNARRVAEVPVEAVENVAHRATSPTQALGMAEAASSGRASSTVLDSGLRSRSAREMLASVISPRSSPRSSTARAACPVWISRSRPSSRVASAAMRSAVEVAAGSSAVVTGRYSNCRTTLSAPTSRATKSLAGAASSSTGAPSCMSLPSVRMTI